MHLYENNNTLIQSFFLNETQTNKEVFLRGAEE